MTEAASPSDDRIDRGTVLALVAMALGVFVVANDFTALSVALPDIESDFDSESAPSSGSSTGTRWCSAS